jgi:uncharacterized protein involved in exopolysaccharide biosynthesis
MSSSSESHLPAENEPGPEDVFDQLAESGAGRERQVWVMYPEAPSPPERARETPFEEFLQLVPEAAWHGRRFLFKGALIGLCFGLGYLYLADAVFMVKSLVHVERRQSVTQAYDPVRAGSTFIATQAEVVSSPRIVRSTLEAIGLPEPSNGWISQLKSQLKAWFKSDPGLDRLEVATRATVPLLQATPVLGTEVMAITYRTEDPQRGVLFLTSLIDSYRGFLSQGETSAHQEGLELLRQRELEIAALLAERRNEFERMLTTERSADDAGGLDVQRHRLEEHARGLVAVENEVIRLENQIASLRRQDVTEVANDETLLEELRLAETNLAELTSRLSERHPDVRQARQRAQTLRAQVESDARAAVSTMERDLNAARQSQAQLAESYDRQWEVARRMERSGVEEERMRAEIARLEGQRLNIADLLAGKELRVLELGSERTGTLVNVLEAPMLPVEPVWPLPGPVLVGCAFIGALGGISWAIVRYVQARGVLRVRPAAGTRAQASEF